MKRMNLRSNPSTVEAYPKLATATACDSSASDTEHYHRLVRKMKDAPNQTTWAEIEAIKRHHGGQIPRENPARSNCGTEECLPPLYKLNWFLIGRKERFRPAFPLQIMMSPNAQKVPLTFWGTTSFDVHIAFPKFRRGVFKSLMISGVNYGLMFGGTRTDFEHTFTSANVSCGLNGLVSDLIISKPFKKLDNMPALPSDWYYFQFVN